MKKLKHLFGEIDMTWGRVILLAVAAAVVTAAVALIPALDGTSFEDLSISYECWFIFAILIAVNCRRWWEASLKVFVFFLISQPLIFLIEVPFAGDGWGVFRYYTFWFKLTLLTLPGAAIAYQLKRKDWLSVPILAVATGYMGYMVIYYLRPMLNNPPYHALSALFCLTMVFLLPVILLDDNRHRIAVMLLSLAVLVASAFLTKPAKETAFDLPEGSWTFAEEDSGIAEIQVTDGNHVTARAIANGTIYVVFTDENGTEVEYGITVSNGNVLASPVR